MDLAEAGLTIGTMVLPPRSASRSCSPSTALVGSFVARREELSSSGCVPGNCGTARSSPGPRCRDHLGPGAVLLLASPADVLLDVPAPPAVYLSVLGLLLGLPLCVGLAARHRELHPDQRECPGHPAAADVPVDAGLRDDDPPGDPSRPDRPVCELLPLTPVMTLVRGGFTGDLSAGGALEPWPWRWPGSLSRCLLCDGGPLGAEALTWAGACPARPGRRNRGLAAWVSGTRRRGRTARSRRCTGNRWRRRWGAADSPLGSGTSALSDPASPTVPVHDVGQGARGDEQVRRLVGTQEHTGEVRDVHPVVVPHAALDRLQWRSGCPCSGRWSSGGRP